jgi:hypothetical protein
MAFRSAAELEPLKLTWPSLRLGADLIPDDRQTRSNSVASITGMTRQDCHWHMRQTIKT